MLWIGGLLIDEAVVVEGIFLSLVRLRAWLAVIASLRICSALERDMIKVFHRFILPLAVDRPHALNLSRDGSGGRLASILTSIAGLSNTVGIDRVVKVLQSIKMMGYLV